MLLQQPVRFVREKYFGKGALSKYLIQSNTHADAFVTSITADKPDSIPPEHARSTVLSPLQSSQTAKRLVSFGPNVAPLSIIGAWLGEVGATIRSALTESSKSSVRSNTSVVSINLTKSETHSLLYQVECQDKVTGQRFNFFTKHVVMATGGRQVIPKNIFSDAVVKKVMKGDYCLTQPGLAELQKRLDKSKVREPCNCVAKRRLTKPCILLYFTRHIY